MKNIIKVSRNSAGWQRKAVLTIVFLLNICILTGYFDYRKYLLETPSTLSLTLQSLDLDTGVVVVNGNDNQCPGTPFTWNWDDGSLPENAWFPRQHVYSDLDRNYILTVTANYSPTEKDTARLLIRFIPPQLVPVALPPATSLIIPDHDIILSPARMPGYNPGELTFFSDDYFQIFSRADVEYILSAAAALQMELCRNKTYLFENAFQQVLLRQVTGSGMASLWYTDPIAFKAAAYAFSGSIQWSSFLHEMGHNFTLNTPAEYYYGGRIDGNANAIYSETMAQIFQHVTVFELINLADDYGLDEDTALEITQSAINSIKLVRTSFEQYLSGGLPFQSWNNPATPQDETFLTFMTLAYKFLAVPAAERSSEYHPETYRIPLQRMMEVLQLFDTQLHQDYDQYNNNPEADAFRATLLVAAISHAYNRDLRSEFTSLNFPVDDDIFFELLTAYAEIRVLLEGPFDAASGLMNHGLADQALLPLTSPSGDLTLAALPEIPGRSLVDWLQIDLKLEPAGEIITSCSVFLLDNGMVADRYGNYGLPFCYKPGTSYYLTIRHRNHLPIASLTAWEFGRDPAGSVLIDLTDVGQVYGDNGQNQLLPGVYGLIAGDADANGAVSPSDRNQHWQMQSGSSGYLNSDFDLNGNVTPADLNQFWRVNTGKSAVIP